MNSFIKSYGWAKNGLRTVWKEEVNFRIEIIVAFVVLLIGAYIKLATLEWVAIVGCIGVVLAAEVLNTAIEDLCNKVEPNTDPVIGKVKDIMAGFVLLISATSVILGLIIFSNHL